MSAEETLIPGSALLNKKLIGRKLKEFRKARNIEIDELEDRSQLTGLAGLEEGARFPQIDTLIRYVYGCGGTLAEFAATLDADAILNQELNPRHLKEIRQLSEILDSGTPIVGFLTDVLNICLRRVRASTSKPGDTSPQ